MARFHVVSHAPTEVHWPDGSVEEMETTHLNVEFAGGLIKVAVGRVKGGRYAFDEERERVHVVVRGSVQAEFVGTDDYEETGKLVAVLKKPGGNKHAWSVNDLPTDYHSFQTEKFADLIRRPGAFGSLGVVVLTGDIEAMAMYGLLRFRDRKSSRSA
jgi:hypothetical protein